jgi:2-dehydro-3-deoxyphosphogluconate aldolase/(4S)-4-hydroxy-2-oxoglutarate aldolase
MDIDRFRELPIIGIMRGIEADSIEPLTERIISSGLKTAEITMNTPGAAELLRMMVRRAGKRLMIGAGTVLSMEDLRSALDAGAAFIVLPTLVENIVGYCAKNKIPVFPGALSPQEIFNAWRAGATMVKVFPAKFFGSAYIKEIKGPFQEIELLACGGVSPANIRDFFSSGASGVAFGGSVFKREWLKERNFSAIEDSIRSIVSSYKNV